MAEWLTALAAQHLVQHRAVMVSVVASYGSAPREPGARMVVTMQAVSGTIGGGALEYQPLPMQRLCCNRAALLLSAIMPWGRSWISVAAAV